MSRSTNPAGTSSESDDPALYEDLRRSWSWQRAREDLGVTGPELNLAVVAVDGQVAAGRGGSTALIELVGGERREVTYDDLRRLSNQVANALRNLGVGAGDRVFSLLGRRLELHLAALGALKIGAIFSPLFTSFGPEPARARLALGEARVLVTTEQLYQRRIHSIRSALPHLEHVLFVSGASDPPLEGTTGDGLDFWALVNEAATHLVPARTQADSPAFLHFTSGTTGTPKGALHVHEAVIAHYATARAVLGLESGDVYWCTADPGWVTGISYGLVAPLAVGAITILDREEFEPRRWYGILEREKVAVWYTAPTAIRMLKRLGSGAASDYDLSGLRFVGSVGEPLSEEAVRWSEAALGRPIHDTWWQTETGAIMLANCATLAVRPGSMGRPVPGIEASLVRSGEDGISLIEEADEVGELALRRGWPSMFRTYLGERQRYEESFVGDWYLSGDLARRDKDGFYWFVGRVDDAIQSAGHLIGPFEVERVMLDHPAVVDVAAVGKSDPLAFEIVTVAVVLADGVKPDDELRSKLLAHARRRLGPAVAPREITFHASLPKTPSGKTMRRRVRETVDE